MGSKSIYNRIMEREIKRTTQQNRALHLYFQMVADELNKAGLDMRVVLKPEIDIPWSKQSVKEFLWRPVQKAYLGKRSTTELTTTDIDAIYDTLNRHLSSRLGEFGTHIPFPSLETLETYDDFKSIS